MIDNKYRFGDVRLYLMSVVPELTDINDKTLDFIIKIVFLSRSSHKRKDGSRFFTREYLQKLGRSYRTFNRLNETLGLFVSDGKYFYSGSKNYVPEAKAWYLTDKWVPIIKELRHFTEKGEDMDIQAIGLENAVDFHHPNLITSLKFDVEKLGAVSDTLPDGSEEAIEIDKLIITQWVYGAIKQKYKQIPCGRVVNTSVFNMQTFPREARKIAFSGYKNYDFKNCHYTIANSFGNFPSINNYVQNTEEIREQISLDIGSDKNDVKVALLALLYGTKRLPYKFSALYEIFKSRELAGRFLEHKIVKGLFNDLDRLIPLLVDLADKEGYIGNRFSRASQYIMNIESKMFLSILDRYKIVLPLHDGFITDEQVDVRGEEKRLKDDFGFEIKIDEKIYA
jgi:hypothetical protein